MSEFAIEYMSGIASEAERLWPELDGLLGRMPRTDCDRKTDCCALLPQMSLLEAARIEARLRMTAETERRGLLKGLMTYFLLNPAKILGCPFLKEKACRIYDIRPFGCRAYGLWSFGSYSRQSEAAVRSKKQVHQAWKNMGIDLPRAVTNHRPPYCRSVRILGEKPVNDRVLEDINRDIGRLDQALGEKALEFNRKYFNDLSFLFAVEMLGMDWALKNKVSVVEEFLEGGHSPSLDHILAKIG